MKKEQENTFSHEIKIEKVACPLHVIQIKKGMNQIESGESLKINSSAYVAPELLAAARQLGSSVTMNSKSEIFVVKT
jgi:TusA-related sulfurtransferase